MYFLNLLSVYLLIGMTVGAANYVVTWRAFRRAGRAGELPEDLLEQSVFHHALAWPETAFWCVLCLLTMVFFVRKRK